MSKQITAEEHNDSVNSLDTSQKNRNFGLTKSGEISPGEKIKKSSLEGLKTFISNALDKITYANTGVTSPRSVLDNCNINEGQKIYEKLILVAKQVSADISNNIACASCSSSCTTTESIGNKPTYNNTTTTGDKTAKNTTVTDQPASTGSSGCNASGKTSPDPSSHGTVSDYSNSVNGSAGSSKSKGSSSYGGDPGGIYTSGTQMGSSYESKGSSDPGGDLNLIIKQGFGIFNNRWAELEDNVFITVPTPNVLYLFLIFSIISSLNSILLLFNNNNLK